jgi:NAD(P)-dependent dehydrogenase (short-subunit alcohol dehydrogenase family)
MGLQIEGIVNCFFHPEIINKVSIDSNTDRLLNLDRAFRSYSPEDFSQELSGNVSALHNVIRFLLPKNLNQKCSIVNVSSVLGIKQPNPKHLEFPDRFRYKPPGYSVSKAALIAYTEYLANLYSGSSFRFNSVAPGFIDEGQEESFKQRFYPRLAIKKFATLDEIVKPIEFLLSDDSQYMSGSTLVIDGGYSKT